MSVCTFGGRAILWEPHKWKTQLLTRRVDLLWGQTRQIDGQIHERGLPKICSAQWRLALNDYLLRGSISPNSGGQWVRSEDSERDLRGLMGHRKGSQNYVSILLNALGCPKNSVTSMRSDKANVTSRAALSCSEISLQKDRSFNYSYIITFW